eukprot:7787895-Alexandrium_andersonii.AAC.1
MRKRSGNPNRKEPTTAVKEAGSCNKRCTVSARKRQERCQHGHACKRKGCATRADRILGARTCDRNRAGRCCAILTQGCAVLKLFRLVAAELVS